MKKKWIVFSICTLGFFGIAFFGIRSFFYRIPDAISASSPKKSSYFVKVPIISWTNDQIPTPCISVQIETNKIISSLDLGFAGFFSLDNQIINQIENKTNIGSQKRYGLRGKEYLKQVYEIAKIRIGHLAFSRIPVQEEAESFHRNASLKDTECSFPSEPGRIGWETCKLAGDLLLDLANNTIAFCDSVSTCESEGYDLTSYIKTPLLTDRGFIEFNAITSTGSVRCVLDTGCTFNFVDIPLSAGQSIDDFVYDPNDCLTMDQFQIGDRSFAPLMFYKFPLHFPMQIDVILGMDFFMKHKVFLNFTEGFIYIKKST